MVSYSAATSTSTPRCAQGVGQHVAALGGAGDQRALDRHVLERLHQPLGDRALRHHVGLDPALPQCPRGARADRRNGDAGQLAGVAQAVHAAARRRSATSRRRGRSTRSGGSVVSSGRIRIAGVSTTAAPRVLRRAARALACARARVTATVRPCSGLASSHASCSRRRGDGPDQRDRGGADPLLRGAVGDVAQRGKQRSLAGERAALDDSDGLGLRPSAGHEALRDPRQRADAHVEHERPREARQGGPVEAGLRLRGILVAGDERDGARGVAVGDGDACVGGSGDPGGDARHHLERHPASPSTSASSPPRPNTNGSPPFRRTTRRPARACSSRSAWVSACGTCGPSPSLPT